MGSIRIDETCSCGAQLSVIGSTYRSVEGGGTNGQHRSAEEIAERWRAEHKHVESVRNKPRIRYRL